MYKSSRLNHWREKIVIGFFKVTQKTSMPKFRPLKFTQGLSKNF